MGQRFRVLRCFSCGTFQVHQVKKSKKWSCKMCGEKQLLLKAYGQGSGSDCRRHVQKLNLLRAGTEVAAEGTSWCIEEPLNDNKENTAVPHEENMGWQEEEVEFIPVVSRWNKYLDKDSEDQEEEVYTDREQLNSHKRKIVEEQRKRKSSFCHNDAQECFEEKGIYGLADQAKKVKTFESRKDSTTVAEQDCGDYICNSIVVPAINEFWVPENTQAPESADVTVSKWEKFLLSPSSCNNGNLTLAAQKNSWKLETQGASAGNFLMADGYPQQEEDSVSPGTGTQTEKSFTNNKYIAQKYTSKLHSTTLAASVQTAFDISHAAIGDVLSGKYKDHLIRAGSDVAENNEGRLYLACTVMPANCLSKDTVTFASTDPFANSSGVPQCLTALNSSLFCTDDDFDDDL
ncbi:MRN complex-interacting protein isoform X1 [Caretta caretta]|uniref:MRN complex-interacting protein isoform X1 n=2 Tax=Caretta caretta TaxID=8467 RepID=UPI0020964077|nr:MRN complex-interacting protein isoform X1 [Caretta caretta]